MQKMVEGHLRKYFEDVVLLEQKFVMNHSVKIQGERENGKPADREGTTSYVVDVDLTSAIGRDVLFLASDQRGSGHSRLMAVVLARSAATYTMAGDRSLMYLLISSSPLEPS